MQLTYDGNGNGVLIIRADSQERDWLRELVAEKGLTSAAECDALEPTLCNSEFDWIAAEEIGALTDAPILGLRDGEGEPTFVWAFMDYQIRSFLEDLIEKGETIFIS